MELGGSGPRPKDQTQALTDGARLQISRTPPDVDPQGVNPLRTHSNKTTTQPKYISRKMKLDGSGTNPKGENQALTDNVRAQSIRTQPPDVDPQGINPPRTHPNKKTTIQSNQIHEKMELDGSGPIPKGQNQATRDDVRSRLPNPQ